MTTKIKTLWTVSKLGFTGLIVASIAFAFGVLDADLEVAESEADILSFGMKEVTPRAKFESSMKDLGHSKPQAFNLNGNVVYFSTRVHDEAPQVVMEEYIQKFKEKGMWPKVTEFDEASFDEVILNTFNGGIAPIHVSENHVFMGGVVASKPITSPEHLEALGEEVSFAEVFKGFHNVEISRMGSTTVATSSWSDENFDIEKMVPGNDQLDQNIDPDVPACPGCTRVSSFEDLDQSRTYRNNAYESSLSAPHLLRFYDQAMTSRGWQLSETSQYMEKMREYVRFEGQEALQREYEKDGELVTILTHPDETGHGATAHTVVAN